MIHDLFLKEIIPFTMYKYIDNKFFPVIIGGVDITRCTNNYLKSDINDIDIKFYCKSDSDVDIYKAHTYRMEMLNEFLEKYNALKRKDMPELFISTLQVQFNRRVEIYYMNEKSKVTVIDTGVMVINNKKSTQLIKSFHNYSYLSFMDNIDIDTSLKVEYENNVPYISCDWLYIDTVRMLLVWLDDYKEAEKSNKLYVKKKIVKYILKLSAMNIAYLKNRKSKKYFTDLVKKIKSIELDGIQLDMLLKEVKNHDSNIVKFDMLMKKCQNKIEYLLKFDEINENLFKSIPNQVKPAKNNTVYVRNIKKREVLDIFLAHYKRVEWKYETLSVKHPEQPFEIIKNSIIFDNTYTLINVK
jgi:hypothetical protein